MFYAGKFELWKDICGTSVEAPGMVMQRWWSCKLRKVELEIVEELIGLRVFWGGRQDLLTDWIIGLRVTGVKVTSRNLSWDNWVDDCFFCVCFSGFFLHMFFSFPPSFWSTWGIAAFWGYCSCSLLAAFPAPALSPAIIFFYTVAGVSLRMYIGKLLPVISWHIGSTSDSRM